MANAAVVLVSPHLEDITMSDLEDLSKELQAAVATSDEDVSFTTQGQQNYGPGTDWVEILNCVVPSAEFIKEAVWTSILGSTGLWLRHRFSRPHEGVRPRVLVVYDSEGHIIRKYRLEAADAPLAEDDDPS